MPLVRLGWGRNVSVLLLGEQDSIVKFPPIMPHPSFCRVALGAAADRSIRTPTSRAATSTAQHVQQAEEDRLVRVPPQQAIDQFPTGPEDLARQTHEGIHERLELRPEHPSLLRLVPFLPPARLLWQR